MNPNYRYLLAFAIVFVDAITIGIPVTAIYAAYLLVVRPAWFKEWIDRIYEN